MSTADRNDAVVDPADVATRLREASFVRIVARADGDGVAAAGVLATALGTTDTPFQVSATRTVSERTERAESAAGRDDDSETVVVGGATAPGTVRVDGTTGDDPATPASVAAWRVARDLTDDPEDCLALAGAVAAGVRPGTAGTTPILERAREAGLGRRPGVAVPVADLADGLAHSTLVHAPFSGDPERARAALVDVGIELDPDGDAGPDRGRRVASLVAIETTGHEAATPGAADAVERALRPAVPGGPFRTLGGYADVLDAVARETPGTAVALALGRAVEEAALDRWREHASRAHSAVRAATTGRYDGLLAARVDATGVPVGTVARLLGSYRSPEPVALVVADGRAGAVADGPGGNLGAAMRSAADGVGGRTDGTPRRAYAEFDDADPTAFIAAFREALS